MEVLMRHLGSIALSLLLGPIVYVLTGVGLVRLADVPGDWYSTDPNPVAIGLGALVLAGALYAILVLVRLSPLGPVLVGLGYLGLTAWGLLRPDSLTSLIPERYVGSAGVTGAPAFGVSLLLAVPLLATIGSPRRWRRRPDAAHPSTEDTAGGYPTSPGPAYANSPGAPISTPPATTPAPAGRDLPSAPEPGEQTTALPVPNAPTRVAQEPAAPKPTPVTPTLTVPAAPASPPVAPQPRPVPPPSAQSAAKAAQTGAAGSSQTWPVSPGPADSEVTHKLPDEPGKG